MNGQEQRREELSDFVRHTRSARLSPHKARRRILVTNEPRSYREAVAYAIQRSKPGAEVIAVEPAGLDSKMERLTPQQVIGSCVIPTVEAGVLAWIERYAEYQSVARLSLGDRRSLGPSSKVFCRRSNGRKTWPK